MECPACVKLRAQSARDLHVQLLKIGGNFLVSIWKKKKAISLQSANTFIARNSDQRPLSPCSPRRRSSFEEQCFCALHVSGAHLPALSASFPFYFLFTHPTYLFVFPLKAFRVLVFTSFEIFCFPLGKMHPSGHQQRSEMSSAFPSLSSSSGPVPGCFQLPPGGEKFKLENFFLFHLFV